MTIRVAVCDDMPELRTLLRFALQEDAALEVVGEAEDADEALLLVEDLRPHVLVLDLSMPGTGGLAAIPLLRRAAPDTAIVVYSALPADQLGPQVLAAGAERYVEKGVPLDELRRAVREAGEAQSASWP
ncbi:MAG: response regulator transcription factor [Solirubrobacterales bacterium]|nr:response regulator transcription factor [Solirubrobacterales bacterium]